ncbi:MAG: hypothetical protein JW846_06795 [Dehalococcoidia bacterium]|nr:hypothetical protein [Dehalococcoidia bacterium]
MKPVFGVIAVCAMLLVSLTTVACNESSAQVEPTDEVEVSAAPKDSEEVDSSVEPEVDETHSPEATDESEDSEDAASETSSEADTAVEIEPVAEPEAPDDSGPELIPATELEHAYTTSVIDYVSAIGESVNVAGSLFSEPQYDDDSWNTLISAYLSQIEGSPEAFKEVDPPPSLEDFSDAALSLLEHCSTFATLMIEAVEDEETEVPEDAVEALKQADLSLADMGTALNAFLELHPMMLD